MQLETNVRYQTLSINMSLCLFLYEMKNTMKRIIHGIFYYDNHMERISCTMLGDSKIFRKKLSTTEIRSLNINILLQKMKRCHTK
jgi:hypothetical protein